MMGTVVEETNVCTADHIWGFILVANPVRIRLITNSFFSALILAVAVSSMLISVFSGQRSISSGKEGRCMGLITGVTS